MKCFITLGHPQGYIPLTETLHPSVCQNLTANLINLLQNTLLCVVLLVTLHGNTTGFCIHGERSLLSVGGVGWWVDGI